MLVSLAVLGLIAGLTVPSIVTSVQKAKNKAMQKETIQMISEVISAGVMNGDFANISNWDLLSPTSPIPQYFTSKLNATQCIRGQQVSPCDHKMEANTVSDPFNEADSSKKCSTRGSG